MILPGLPELVIDDDVVTTVSVDDGDIIVTTHRNIDVVTASGDCNGSSMIIPDMKLVGSDEWWREFWGDRWILVVLMIVAMWLLLEVAKLVKGMYLCFLIGYV